MSADMDSLWFDDQDDIPKYLPRKNAVPNGEKDMESSKRYLLQAEIEYWHEMLLLNQSRVSKIKENEMRNCLKQAIRALNTPTIGDFKVAA
jgi:hypothetical protein